MNERPRRILRQLLADTGPALLNDPARLDALLADLCGEYPKERFLLVQALRERAAVATWPVMYWLETCAQRLQSQRCFAAEAAQWAAESWASALNIAPPDPSAFHADGDLRHGSHVALSESAQHIVCQLVTDYGPPLLEDPARAQALLADLCGAYPRERFLLVQALRQRVAADLLSQPQGGAAHGQQLAQRLQQCCGFSVEAAQWAVESWAVALHGEALPVPRGRRDAGSIAPNDRDVLGALYHATNGANWSNKENWLSNAPLSVWRGITTDSSGRVITLSLKANQLAGSIPAELGNLANLWWLDLSDNQLSGPIPPELGNLSKLERLSLESNQLSGPIPTQLGNLSNLWWLYLSHNQLSGTIPPELGNLTKLERLSLESNQLRGPIPPQLGNLAKLWWLYLSHNQLSGTIPPELGNLTKLERLSLESNQLRGPVPAELRNLPYLKKLILDDKNRQPGRSRQSASHRGSQSTPTARSVSNDRDVLVALYHAANGANWSNRENWLSAAPLSAWYGVTTDISGRVTQLSLKDNQLEGSIPAELGNLANLWWLDLSHNQLRGPIPPELGNLPKLGRLSLRSNQLHGSIPPQLGNLTNLAWALDLSHNQLCGSIPPELGNLTKLERLSLKSNQLRGSIPTQLGNLANLTWALDLSHNQLRGSIPPELGNLSKLQRLSLKSNQLRGPVPPQLGNLANLWRLDLSHNQLRGTIPPELGNLANLTELDLSDNQ